MPTPLSHFTLGRIIYKSKKTLSLPGLIIGSIIPDMDIVFSQLTGGYVGRELLHSFVGAGTLGTLLSTLLVVLVYPRVISTFFRIDKEEVKRACKLSKNLLSSSFIGGLSHILIDATCHNYNPLFYPFTRESIDLLLLTTDWKQAYFLVELLLTILLGILIFSLLRRKSQKFWKLMLVGN